ncbi:hypothetical protein P8452_73245 [Trifolium repens]|nr:hypothetical protein P8452_73245 [Trifolium repens]
MAWKNLEVHEFKTGTGVCSAFLANYDTKYAVTVKYGDEQYELPPWSVSIFPNCKTAVFNTARLDTQSSLMKMTAANRAFSWHSYNKEPASSNERDSITAYALWEQINVTRDSTHYLWYMTDVNIDPNEGFLRNEQSPLLTIMSACHAMHVFINGQLSGSVVGNNKISLLGITVGLLNVGVHFET